MKDKWIEQLQTDKYLYQFVNEVGVMYEGHGLPLTPDGLGTSTTGRKELHGQPTFYGWVGPMYNGTKEDETGKMCPVIRYETMEVYRSYD